MGGLVFADLLPSVASLAVTVAVPAVFRVTLRVRVPLAKAAFVGKAALLSDDVIAIVSVTLVRTFQLASTALTTTLNAFPAV